MSSDEPVQYNWTKNSQPVTGNDVIMIDNVLIVTPRAEEDYGVYVCKATNSVGSAQYNITLKEEAKNSTDCNSTKENEGICCHSLEKLFMDAEHSFFLRLLALMRNSACTKIAKKQTWHR